LPRLRRGMRWGRWAAGQAHNPVVRRDAWVTLHVSAWVENRQTGAGRLTGKGQQAAPLATVAGQGANDQPGNSWAVRVCDPHKQAVITTQTGYGTYTSGRSKAVKKSSMAMCPDSSPWQARVALPSAFHSAVNASAAASMASACSGRVQHSSSARLLSWSTCVGCGAGEEERRR